MCDWHDERKSKWLCDIRRNFSRLAGLLEIGDNVLDDREIDAVILQELVNTDEDIMDINRELEKIFHTKIEKGISDSEHDIMRLRWLNIRTLSQLKEIIAKDKKNAIEIARYIIQSDRKKEYHIDETIGFFYLCYAELLSRFHDIDMIRSYFEDNYIMVEEQFIEKMLQIQKQLGL